MRRRRRRLAVRGLVRLRERVRDQVSRGLDPDALFQLSSEVESVVAGLEKLCRDAGTSPARLAAPTRNAYRYLKSLRFDRLPAGHRPLAPSIRLFGLTAAYDRALAAATADRPDFAAVRERAAGVVAAADALCARRGLAPGELPARSAAAYQALHDLASPGRAEIVADTVRRGRAIAAAILARRRVPVSRPLVLRLRRTASFWRLREGPSAIDLVLSDAFAGAPQPVLEALVGWALSRAGASGRALVEEWLQARQEAPPAAPRSRQARGLHHDLDALFDEVNREHFGGLMARPRLAWSAGPTFHRFGYYTYSQDRVVLSATLDRGDVPVFVVAYVLFHELLHKQLGVTGDGARRRAHTREFRERERGYPRYPEAVAFLDRLARRGRR